jgi:beta-phosphoglucomutase
MRHRENPVQGMAGIEAAKNGGMRAVALGTRELLPGADWYIASLRDMLPA